MVSKSSREKSAEVKRLNSIFNKYVLEVLGRRGGGVGVRAEKRKAKIAEIDAVLLSRKKERKVQEFVDGKRIGVVTKEVPLLPSEVAKLMAKRNGLQEKMCVSAEKRAEFLSALQKIAAINGWSRDTFIGAGVPLHDLDEANILF